MMFRRLLFACAAALPLLASAQTPLGQPSIDEAKVQIWCATVRFVYDDAGRPNLKSTVRCEGANLDALAASIRPDSLRVYSLLYQPIEGRGSIYQGKKDNPARLAALAKAIIGKLKASPARRRDPARMVRVAALETALTNYVVSGTPPGDVPEAMTPQAPDTTASAGASMGAAEAAEAQVAAERAAGAGTPSAALPATGPGSLLNRFAAPLALILGILSLVLYIMLRVTLGQWRRQQRRETLTAKQAATAAQAAAAETNAAVADSVARVKRAEALVLAAAPDPNAPTATSTATANLSPAQRLEVERLVSQRVDEELRWLRANLPELIAAAVAQPVGADDRAPTTPAPATAGSTGPVADDVQLD
ncbi:hypothetical protein AUC43_05970 [Hymenobacter sedentarius]|uniref:Uncharacterized protein n=1 Tax=Hymenobacter sedentarius TaxID=1411621 RepID=A0A0U4C965_9BACT|nr:hypothetical protein [Hymenobacter sedentarius]ALW84665.1 hypothetical protein AUC43_05970 [Hymenobacter sedentarius]